MQTTPFYIVKLLFRSDQALKRGVTDAKWFLNQMRLYTKLH